MTPWCATCYSVLCVSCLIRFLFFPQALWYMARHCEADVIIVDSLRTFQMLRRIAARLPDLKAVIQWSGSRDPEATDDVRVCLWSEFMSIGSDVRELDVRIRCGNIMPGNPCCVAYNAGTTGHPMGVLLSHDNFTWTAKQIATKLLRVTSTDTFLSYLPCAHTAAQILDIHVPMVVGAHVVFTPHAGVLKSGIETMLADVQVGNKTPK